MKSTFLSNFVVTRCCLVCAVALVMFALPTCRRPVDDTFEEMFAAEEELDLATERLEAQARLLASHWDTSELQTELVTYRERIKDLVRERYQIQRDYDEEGGPRYEVLQRATDWLNRVRSLTDAVAQKREQIDTLGEMTSSAQIRLAEVLERAQVARMQMNAVEDRQERIVFESKMAALDKVLTQEARSLLEDGMKHVQNDASQARIVFGAGMAKLDDVDRALERLLMEIRAELAGQGAAQG